MQANNQGFPSEMNVVQENTEEEENPSTHFNRPADATNLLKHLPNSYDSTFENFQQTNTFQTIDKQTNPKFKLEFISNLNDSSSTPNKTTPVGLNSTAFGKFDTQDALMKENRANTQENSGQEIIQGQLGLKNALRGKSQVKDQARPVLADKPHVLNIQNSNSLPKGAFFKPDIFRPETEETAYDNSDEESIYELDNATGSKLRKKPTLLKILEQRRTINHY